LSSDAAVAAHLASADSTTPVAADSLGHREDQYWPSDRNEPSDQPRPEPHAEDQARDNTPPVAVEPSLASHAIDSGYPVESALLHDPHLGGFEVPVAPPGTGTWDDHSPVLDASADDVHHHIDALAVDPPYTGAHTGRDQAYEIFAVHDMDPEHPAESALTNDLHLGGLDVSVAPPGTGTPDAHSPVPDASPDDVHYHIDPFAADPIHTDVDVNASRDEVPEGTHQAIVDPAEPRPPGSTSPDEDGVASIEVDHRPPHRDGDGVAGPENGGAAERALPPVGVGSLAEAARCQLIEGAFETSQALKLGNLGERLAADTLAGDGHTILYFKPDILGTNQGGIDIVTIKDGIVHLVDNKALSRTGNVNSVSALTTNLEQNVTAVLSYLGRSLAEATSGEQREVLQSAIAAIQAGQVRTVVTNANFAKNGVSVTGVSESLRVKGMKFIDLLRRYG
jgi:Holliday junction resolvase-like predicted endonuclease